MDVNRQNTEDEALVTKIELLDKLWSGDNELALQAVDELRVRGWLCNGSLTGIAICRATLQGADLRNANLSNVDLHQAQLEFSDLSMTNLRGAKLIRANLNKANLNQTDLTGADLYKANLSEARNLTDEQLAKVKRLWGATMPDGEPYDGRYNLEGDLTLARLMSVDINDPKKMAVFFGISFEAYSQGQQWFDENVPLMRSLNLVNNTTMEQHY